jgi:general secretion pathway protein C
LKKFGWLERLKAKFGKKNTEDDLIIHGEISDEDNIPSAPNETDRATPVDMPSGPSSLAAIFQSDENFNVKKIVRSVKRPPLEDYYPYILGAWLGFAGADLTTTAIRPMLSTPPISTPSRAVKQDIANQYSQDYEVIVQRNVFDSENKIPDAIGGEKQEEELPTDGPATPSRLPLKLLGTIVHYNPGKSVASIEVRAGQTKSLPYIPNDNIEGIAVLMKVERQKAFIRNLSNNRLEYIEMEIEGNLTFGKAPTSGAAEVATGIKKDGNNFTVSKDELQKQLKNLPELLQQARAVPYRDPYTGEMAGFKIVDIKAGSIFEKLLERGDVIKEVNGTKVNSAAKAMEMYRTLKNSSDVKLTVERNGRDEVLDFTVQ